MSLKVGLSRKYEFSAAHRLNSPHLSEEENRAVYDKCNNPMGHGHDYILEVTVCGDPDPDTGMILSLEKFDAIVNEVLTPLDHHHLDYEIPYFKEHPSTGEEIVRFIWLELDKRFPGSSLGWLKLWETNNNYFEYGRLT